VPNIINISYNSAKLLQKLKVCSYLRHYVDKVHYVIHMYTVPIYLCYNFSQVLSRC